MNDAREARDDAFDRMALRNPDFGNRCRFACRNIPKGWTGTGEKLRYALLAMGVKPPEHPNQWGGFIASLIRDGLFEKTGTHAQMEDPKSHARESPVLRRL